MKQAKKIFTRMLMNNWGGVSHKIMEFHEYVNLFSGKSGSGKSTVMDAIQVVLYGSISATFLNKAADDAKNRRSVLSYLRGAQKDGSYNRDGQDFCSQIVLEIFDTGTKVSTCIGVAFEVGKNDTDIRKYTFFSHSGKIPEDEYLTEKGVPYTIAGLRKLVEKRVDSSDNRGRGDVNRLYPSKEAYLKTVYDVIFGYVEPGRMMTMEKSAIALRMTNGTGQLSVIICSRRVRRTRFRPSVTSLVRTVRSKSVWKTWRIGSIFWMRSAGRIWHFRRRVRIRSM